MTPISGRSMNHLYFELTDCVSKIPACEPGQINLEIKLALAARIWGRNWPCERLERATQEVKRRIQTRESPAFWDALRRESYATDDHGRALALLVTLVKDVVAELDEEDKVLELIHGTMNVYRDLPPSSRRIIGFVARGFGWKESAGQLKISSDTDLKQIYYDAMHQLAEFYKNRSAHPPSAP
jgi:hypothetical protein